MSHKCTESRKFPELQQISQSSSLRDFFLGISLLRDDYFLSPNDERVLICVICCMINSYSRVLHIVFIVRIMLPGLVVVI